MCYGAESMVAFTTAYGCYFIRIIFIQFLQKQLISSIIPFCLFCSLFSSLPVNIHNLLVQRKIICGFLKQMLEIYYHVHTYIQRWEFIKENMKTRKKDKRTRPREWSRKKENKEIKKQELDQESNQEKKKVFSFFLGRFLVFLIAFLVEFLFSCFLL